jgi:hypothetical protein
MRHDGQSPCEDSAGEWLLDAGSSGRVGETVYPFETVYRDWQRNVSMLGNSA